jgi:hypothetical protein
MSDNLIIPKRLRKIVDTELHLGESIAWIGQPIPRFLIWKAARSTVYLVTNKQAITIQGGKSTVIKSCLPKQLDEIYRKEQDPGIGDTILEIIRWQGDEGSSRLGEVGFMEIYNPRAVEMALKQLT